MDFSKVTALQIPEGNVTKIEDKEGNILWSNINKFAYGVRWSTNTGTACERIGNLELHKTLPIQSRFKVCIHKGKEIQYYCNPDDSRFVDFNNAANKDEINAANFNITNKTTLGNIFYLGANSQGATSLDDETATNYYLSVTEDRFSNYRWLYAYVKITGSDKNVYVGRIINIDTSTKTAIIELTEDLDSMQPFTNIELGCSINGYDGEIGVDTGGKFYQWSVDKDGAGNEVWISEHKCVSYAKEVKRHIIGCSRACVLNTAFNDDKWGWIGSLQDNTAVNVINYNIKLRGGTNTSQFDKYLGVDNFRCQFNKGRTGINLAKMRTCTQKLSNHQVLYKQLWEAIIWCWCIEYAQLDVQTAYNNNLDANGYRQGGLGKGYSVGGANMPLYNNNECCTPCDYTLHLGNNTGIRTRAARQYGIPVDANHYWDYYNTNDVVSSKSIDNKTLTITNTKVLSTNRNIFANPNVVGGTVTYKISGLTDGQTIVFKREKDNLTITTDGTYDVEWGTSNVLRKIYFGKLQTTCNIVIEIVNAPAYNMIQGNQVAWNVPHWRGFNVFWYGDIWINIENFLSKYDNTKKRRIYYWTDDVSKFDGTIDNKEHSIENPYEDMTGWIIKFNLGKQGNLTPRSCTSANWTTHKNVYCNDNISSDVNTFMAGGATTFSSWCGLASSRTDISNSDSEDMECYGFVTCTIIDD